MTPAGFRTIKAKLERYRPVYVKINTGNDSIRTTNE